MLKNTLTRHLRPLLESTRITALDVGARGGFTKDLLPIASAVDSIGFEPDPEECRRLNEQDSGPWRSLRFVPAALGRTGTRNLNIYRKRGCSSFLEADVELAKRFERDSYFSLDDTIPVDTLGLDEAAGKYGFQNADFLKIDIQGAEMEVFDTGPRLLDQILAVRTEVSFIPVYRDQPLIEDVMGRLRNHGLVPMGFQELHHWRRKTRVKPHRSSQGNYPYSEGQVVHGDMLFLRDHEDSKDSGSDAVDRVVRTALIALAYGYIDHAHHLLDQRSIHDVLRSNGSLGLDQAMASISRCLDRHHRTVWTRFRAQTRQRMVPFKRRLLRGSGSKL